MVVTSLLQVRCGIWTKHRESDNGIATHYSFIFYEHIVKDSHPELFAQYIVDVLVKVAEAVVHVGTLPLKSIVEVFAVSK